MPVNLGFLHDTNLVLLFVKCHRMIEVFLLAHTVCVFVMTESESYTSSLFSDYAPIGQ